MLVTQGWWTSPKESRTLPFDRVILWQIKNLMFSLPQHIWPPNLADWLPREGETQSTKTSDFFITRSRDKWKTYYLQNTTLQSSNAGWRNPIERDIWSCGHVTNKKLTSKTPIATGTDRVVTLSGVTQFINSHDII